MDLEKTTAKDVAKHLRGADAVVFAAGAGPGSGAARKESVDRDAAVLLAHAAEAAGVGRYLRVSAMGDHLQADPSTFDEEFGIYMRAKAAAEDAIRARTALRTTIIRPGLLSNEPGTGRVGLAERTGTGPIPRADVAAVLLALLDEPRLDGRNRQGHQGRHPGRGRRRGARLPLTPPRSPGRDCRRRRRPARTTKHQAPSTKQRGQHS